MEFPHLGRNCSFRTCNRLDFLPMKCGACLGSFCSDHFAYTNHECPAPYNRDVQVPECPLCGVPVPGRRGEQPDVAVSEHIDNQCQSDPAKERRKKVYTNRCAFKGCKTKEMIPVVCHQCSLNYCLKHRHTADHSCDPLAAKRRRAAEAAMVRLQNGQSNKIQIGSNPGRARVSALQEVQGNMSEDEALATALSLSLQACAGAGAAGGAGVAGDAGAGAGVAGDAAAARALARGQAAVGGQSQARRPSLPLPRPPRRASTAPAHGARPQLNFRNICEIAKILGAALLTLYVLASLKYMFGRNSTPVSPPTYRRGYDDDL